jgi:2,3,4,5-tetrahydropyridine-2,6-dicarboxylate N-succinyltransferase
MMKEIINKLKENILKIYFNELEDESQIKYIFKEFIDCLNYGIIRAAEPDNHGNWIVNAWIKQGILMLFKYGKLIDMSNDSAFTYFDKDTIPFRKLKLKDEIRLVPGGSSIRCGTYIAKGVICMPPMYINIGAYIDEGTMVDSHALVGTCAQIGKRVHLSAGVQIGGVLEPPGARPVIVENDVLIGGNSGIYEGVLIKRRAVIGSGVIINASTKIFDIVNERIIYKTDDSFLEIPEGAVVIPGSRQIDSEFGRKHGLSIYSPIIIKYRDEKTDAKTALEETLR